MSIGTLSARILADASGIKSGLGLTRQELRMTREAFLATRTDGQKLQQALDVLASAKDKGAYKSEQDYAAAVAETRRQLDPTVQAEQRLASAVQQTEAQLQDQIATLGMSAEELARYRLQQQGATQAQLASVGTLQQQLAARKQQLAAASTAEAEAAKEAQARRQAEVAEAKQAAKQIIESQKTGLDRYHDAVRRVEQAKPHLSAQQYATAIRGLRMEALQAVPVLGRMVEGLRAIPGVGGLLSDLGNGGPTLPIAAATAAIGIGIKSLKAWRTEADSIERINRSAMGIGWSTEALLVLGRQAKRSGLDVSEVTAAVAKANKAIGDARQGSETKNALFSSLGLSAKSLGQMAPETAFLKISDALRGMTDPYQRARISSELFGESFAKMDSVLRMGTNTFANLKNEMAAGGELFSSADAERMRQARIAMDGLNESWMAFKQNVAIAAAPEIERRMGGMSAAIAQGSSTMDRLRGIASMMFGAGAGLAGVRRKPVEEAPPPDKPVATPEVADLTFAKMAAEVAKTLAAELQKARKSAADSVAAVTTQIGTWGMSADAAERYKLALQGVSKEELIVIRSLQAVRAEQQATTAVADKATESWFRMWQGVRQQQLQAQQARSGQAGRDPAEQAAGEVAELRRQYEIRRMITQLQREGATPAEVQARVRLAEMSAEYDRQAEALGRRNKLFDEARQAAQSVQTPDQKYGEQIKRYQEMLTAKALSQEEFLRLYRKAHAELSKGLPDPMRVEGVRAGTAAATDRVEQLQRAMRQQVRASQLGEQARREAVAPVQAAEAARVAEQQRQAREARAAAEEARRQMLAGEIDQDPLGTTARMQREADPRVQQARAAGTFGRPTSAGAAPAAGSDQTGGYWQQQLDLQGKILAALQRLANGEKLNLVETG